MYVMDTSRMNRRIAELSELREFNNLLAMAVCAPIEDGAYFDDFAEFEACAKDFQADMAASNIQYSDDESLIASMLTGFVMHAGIEHIMPPTLMHLYILNGKVFHLGDFDDNPYYRDIHFEEQTVGRFKLTHNSYSKYESCMWNTVKFVNGTMIPRVGLFDHEFRYPCITEDDATWMSVTPNEIFTMQPAIDAAHGKVLTLGCGMGYFAYMSALKDDVSKVTIVEKNPEVIELFTKYILPQFSVKDKVEIIQADAFEYMETLQDGLYDYCFADIWIGNMDTLPYLQLKKICKKFEKTEMSYWIEDAMVSTIIGYVWIIILEQFAISHHQEVPSMDLPPDEHVKLDALREVLSDVRITKPEHLDYYMDYRNIIALL